MNLRWLPLLALGLVAGCGSSEKTATVTVTKTVTVEVAAAEPQTADTRPQPTGEQDPKYDAPKGPGQCISNVGLPPDETPGDQVGWFAVEAEGNNVYEVRVDPAEYERQGGIPSDADRVVIAGKWVVWTLESSSVDLVNKVAACIKAL